MNKMRKLLAIVLTFVMVIGMSMTVFAEGGAKPTANDKKSVTVQNVEATATVTAYQIVKANYNDAGFTGYSSVDGVTLKNPLSPTSHEITAIAKGTLPSVSVIMTPGTDTGLTSFTADLAPGYWMVLVTGNANEVYNPMLIGVYYSVSGSDNTMSSGPVDANTNWKLETTDAYAKSTSPVIKKTIANGDRDAAIGDTVNFRIDTAIPSYSEQYERVEVKVSDSLSTGLTLDPDSIVVAVGGKGVAAGDSTYSITSSVSGFEISFVSAYALANSGKSIIVTYSAELNDKAGINFDANTNTASLIYTNNPNGTTKEVKDRTYTYTFGIDAKLNGSSSEEWNEITKELIKGEVVKETTESGTTETFKPLAGAAFTLTNNTTNKVYKATSDKDGALCFTGLDTGTYKLIETAAPEGYTINTAEIPVEISAEYNNDGTLKSYSIKVNNTVTSTYEATYEGDTIVNKTITNIVKGKDNKTTQIMNTKITSLPSTGGIGTTIFTIGGCLAMILAAGMFFAGRKKEKE